MQARQQYIYRITTRRQETLPHTVRVSSAARSSPACSAPVLCGPVERTAGRPCLLADDSGGLQCAPSVGAVQPARRLASQQQVLWAPAGSFSGEQAVRAASLAAAQLAELESRLTPLLQRPVPDGVDLTDLDTAATDDSSVTQEVGRIGLQRLFTVQAISNQTEL